MSDQSDSERKADGAADAIAVIAIMAVVLAAVIIWLHRMPT